MELYGNVAITQYTFDRWYLQMPEFWCRDANYIRTHPYPNNVNDGWGEINTNLYNFYKLDMEWAESEKIMDLRGEDWKQRLSTFIMWYGHGWTSPGGLWEDTSPLEHILFLGNYNVLSAVGYRWVVVNHGPDKDGKFVELWFYLDPIEGPDSFYTLTKLDNEEFLK